MQLLKWPRLNLTSGRRGVLAILAGTATGQVLAVAVSPVLSRLYTPADFGVFSVVSALAICLGTVAALRFELAIPLPKADADAYSLVYLGLVCTASTALFGTIVMLFVSDLLADLFDAPGAVLWIGLVPCIAAPMAAFRVLNQFAIRQGRYNAIARRNLLQSISTIVTQVGLGFTGLRAGGLIAGFAAGQTIGAISLLPGSGLQSQEARSGRRRSALLATTVRYRRFPLLLAPSGLLNALGVYLPVLLVAYWYGSTAAGWFGLTQRVIALPVMLIGQAVAQVYLSELARSKREDTGRERALFRSASKRLILVGAVGAATLIVAGPRTFDVVFGPAWTMSGQMAQAMAIALAGQLIASPVSQTLIVFERTVVQLCWDVGRLVLVTGAVAGCALADLDVLKAVWAYGVASAVAYAVSWELSRRTLRRTRPRDGRSAPRDQFS